MAEPLDTRSQLIDATVKELVETGPGSLRVSTIAQAVGISEASVYHFFKNKLDLVESAQIESYRRSHLEMVVPFQAAVDLSETNEDFRRAIKKLFAMVHSPERYAIRAVRIQALGAAVTSERLRKALIDINGEVQNRVTEVIKSGQKLGWVNPNSDARSLAYWINGVIMGRVFIEMDPEWGDTSQWDEISVNAVLRAFHPAPE
jgi:AcrR family transcriptional regulator